ncbi:stage II sporulation protein M [archaeon]|nr:stage II sporulation protein M [archaeon]
MVLERIVSIRDAVKNPWWMFVIGGMVSVISSFIALFVFPSSVGLFSVFIITFIMTPFMVNLMSYEEATTEMEIKRKVRLNFLQRHADVLGIYVAFFGGMVLALSVLFLMLPQATVEKIFQDQITEINIIRGSAIISGTFQKIILNNISVMVISFLFAFLFGSGAIFILAWNASVLASAIGLTAKSLGGLTGLPAALLTFIPHGSLEIAAYFIAGIAGGLVSAALTRKRSSWFFVVFKDSLKLMAVAMLFLIVAGLIEVAVMSF